jgi:hypothetical protein
MFLKVLLDDSRVGFNVEFTYPRNFDKQLEQQAVDLGEILQLLDYEFMPEPASPEQV